MIDGRMLLPSLFDSSRGSLRNSSISQYVQDRRRQQGRRGSSKRRRGAGGRDAVQLKGEIWYREQSVLGRATLKAVLLGYRNPFRLGSIRPRRDRP